MSTETTVPTFATTDGVSIGLARHDSQSTAPTVRFSKQCSPQHTDFDLTGASDDATTVSNRILDSLDQIESMTTQSLDEYRSCAERQLAELPVGFKLSIVIPVYNEKDTILKVIGRVAALPIKKEIVIVDDCSTDGTSELLEQLAPSDELVVIRQETNAGKGAALRRGFSATTGDAVIVQDADLEYDPRDIPRVVLPIAHGDADVVYGSRFLGDEQQDESWVHRLGNKTLTQMLNVLIGTRLTDMETCYKAFRGDVIRSIDIRQNRFGIEPEMTAKLARRGYDFHEVPIRYNARGYAEGKKIGVRDLFNAFWCIARYGIAD